MKIKVRFLTLAILLCAMSVSYGRVDPEKLKKNKDKVDLSGARMDCQPSVAQYDLEINNVRARLLAGGDMWWDLQEGRYIVPKPAPGFPEVSAIFASGIWLGGHDPNGAIKLAGVTYRNGNATDFYPGPLDENGQTSIDVCNDWDRHFSVKGDNIRSHIANYDQSIVDGEVYPCESIPDDVKYWPARGNPFFNEEYDFDIPDQGMADFWDEDGDGLYNPCNGDYPTVNVRNCEDGEFPDEIVYWTFNDNGGPHRLSQATPIQMEVHASAFGYSTLDELNDMTFYSFKFVNKATDDIRDCYFGLWVDADLGCSEDDYIGCDIERSMGYVYNEDALDGSPGTSCPGGIETYGDQVPLLGIDLFRGPRGPKVYCGFDDEGNVILCDPEPGSGSQDTIVELGMTSFTYQSRGVSNPPEPTQDPDIDYEFYNILQGKWKDGTDITFGGSGFDPASTDVVRHVFSDPPNDPTGWSMCTADLPFDDRRTVQGSGPILMQPGAKNTMVFGVIFVPDVSSYPCPSIERLQFADDKAQALFDNCFSFTEGPDAPDMAGVELDQELILLLSNDPLLINSNNANEQFMEIDLMAPQGVDDPYYRFEGYKIYQLVDQNVSRGELDDIDKARLIRQCDVKNGVGEIYNWYPEPNPNPNSLPFIFIPEQKVDGADEGIQHSFQIKKDLFSTENNQELINGKEYYYTVIAYAYNNWEFFDPIEQIGQKTPYLEGRRNVQTYTFSPRSLVDVDVPTEYGQEVGVTRIQGIGTSNNALDMEEGERESILDGSFDGEITYRPGFSPINPKIVDPLGIQDGQYRLEIVGDYNNSASQLRFEEGATWRLTDISTGEIIASDKSIDQINEQIIPERGFSIQVNQVANPGERDDDDNGAIAQAFGYFETGGPIWWDAIPAFDGLEVDLGGGDTEFLFDYADTEVDDDPENKLTQIDNGQFIPFHSARWLGSPMPYITPSWKESQGFAIAQNKLKLQNLNNVDIIFTPDKSKWSKCVVIETAVADYLQESLSTIDGRKQFDLRASSSVDENGNEIDGEGMSYFPGYAIDVETGERLNIFFGENSVFRTENDELVSQTSGINVNTGNVGADMIWNPTTSVFAADPNAPLGLYNDWLGGQHFIYVTRQEYDECKALSEQLGSGGLLDKINAVSFITWTGIPIPKEPLLSLNEGLIPNELIVRLRVTSPFNKEIDAPDLKNPSKFEAVEGLPVYEFGFEDVEFTGTLSAEEVPDELEDIVVSPNPFYADGLGGGPSTNMVRVSNLPKGSIVTLYTMEGKYIRQFREGVDGNFVENETTVDLEWNLGDSDGIELHSGLYIFHVAVPELGIQRGFKWIKG